MDAAAIYLERNALSGTSEYDASHASIIGCRFDAGLVGIENAGGCGFVTVHSAGWDMHADGNNLNMVDGMEAVGRPSR